MTPRRLFLALALLGACPRAPAPRRPDLPLPADLAVLPVFDPAGVVRGAPPDPDAAPLLPVEVGPQGRQDRVHTLFVRFNQAAVPLDLRRDDPALARLFHLDPPVAGAARWLAPDHLVFEPTEPLAPATRYTVRLAGELPGGRPLAEPRTWSFETPRPQVRDVWPYDDETEHDPRAPVLLELDQPADPAGLAAHLVAHARPLAADAPVAPVALTVRRTTMADLAAYGREYDSGALGRLYTVRPAGGWPLASRVDLELRPGLVGEAGPLPLDAPWALRLRTPRPQALESATCTRATPCGLDPILLTLRNEVDPDQEEKISVTPRPDALDIDLWDRHIEIRGDFLPGRRYTVRVAGLADAFGQTLPTTTHTAVFVHQAALALSDGSGILRRARPHVGVESRHLRSVEVRLGLYDDAELAALAPFDHLADDEALRALPFPARTVTRTVPLEPRDDTRWDARVLDLAALAGAPLPPAVLVEVRPGPLVGAREAPPPARGLFRVTDLALVAHASLPGTVVQAVDLTSGAPLAGVQVCRLGPAEADRTCRPVGRTDADGLLRADELPLPTAVRPRWRDPDAPDAPTYERVRLVARDPASGSRADLELGEPPHPWRYRLDAVPGLRRGERLLGRLLRERGAYRPGEPVHLVGWAAVESPYARSTLAPLPRGTAVTLELRGPGGRIVARARARSSEFGKFSATLHLPAGTALGDHVATATVLGQPLSAGLKVEDYRVPDFAVRASARTPDILAGAPATVDLRADYYFGGPVQLTGVTRRLACDPLRYRPPGLDPTWTVGLVEFAAHAIRREDDAADVPAAPGDATGRRTVTAVPPLGDPRLAHRCTFSLRAEDAARQGVGAEADVTVHPAPLYLALRLPDRPAEAGDRVAVPLRAVTRDGDRVAAARVRLAVERRWTEPVYETVDGRRVVVDRRSRRAALPGCTVDLAAAGPDAACTVTAAEPGTYHLTTHTTLDGREARTTAEFVVTPPREPPPPRTAAAPDALEIVPSRDQVRPGDPLTVELRGKWSGARGVLVLARAGVREHHPFVLQGGRATVELRADDTWTPAMHLEAHVVTPARPPGEGHPQGVLPRVHRADPVEVTQSDAHRRLRVTVTAPREAGPGDDLPISVTVRDADDRPTAARVALWAVDEAVLALTDEQLPDLLPTFIPRRDAETSTRHDFYALLLPYLPAASDPWLRGGGRGGGGRGVRVPAVRAAAAATAAAGLSTTARERFLTTPLFLADLAVDATGTARTTAPLPDNLTTFRITAIASAPLAPPRTAPDPTPTHPSTPSANPSTSAPASPSTSAPASPSTSAPGRFGGGEARVRVTAPLVLRAAVPRQLRPGDTAELAAIVENRGASAGRVEVTADLVDGPGPNGHALEFLSERTGGAELPAGGQARVAFRVRAGATAEAPRLELRARFVPAGARRRDAVVDAVRVAVPVEAEATLTERVAAYGELGDARAAQLPVRLPQGVLPAHGGLRISTTATILGGLEDAADALLAYPHACAEQTASRLVPLLTLRRLGRPVPGDVLPAALERLATLQTADGGFAYWPGDDLAHPYASAYATWVLQRAAADGLPVPKDMLDRALADLERRAAATDLAGLSEALRTDAGVPLALAVVALAEAGRDVAAPAAALFAQRGALPVFARAALLMALHRADPNDPAAAALAAELVGALREDPREAHTVEPPLRGLDAYFHSDARSDALVLLALLQVAPDHPAVRKLTRGLLAARRGGAWRNTQENAHALLALTAYAAAHEPAPPDLQARAWLGGRTVLDAALRGRNAAPGVSETPMAELLHLTERPGAVLPVTLHRQGEGRLYWRVGLEWAPAGDDLPARDQGLAVARALRGQDGPLAGRVAAGAPVAVDLTVTSRHRARYVAVDVPLPAGLEAVQTDLGRGRRVAAPLPGVDGTWFTRQELRRDRVVLFADELPPGTHRHTVHLRATTRGRFAFPPTRAEAMYVPELYGRSTASTLQVE
jgi:hypothetical protein